MKKCFIVFIITILSFIFCNAEKQTVLLCDPADTYYPLCKEISKNNSIFIKHTFSEAVENRPHTIIYIASPDFLNEEKLFTIARYFKTEDYYPGFGIITGSTIKKARQGVSKMGYGRIRKGVLINDKLHNRIGQFVNDFTNKANPAHPSIIVY